ncbi:MAG: hypothetical protein ACD_61C00077G0006 [uncultured bacterium]|nr:MAG: hypothetical protein ACD_61C00077G0006 [uncultured bacterium]
MKRVLIVTTVTVVTRVIPMDDEKNLPGRTIGDLRNGEIAYTLPWGLGSFRFGRLGIKSSYPISPERKGTLSLKVRRLRDFILVDLSTAEGDEKTPSRYWSEDECLPALFVSKIDSKK